MKNCMKKLISSLLAGAMALSLTACSGSGSIGTQTPNETQESQASNATAEKITLEFWHVWPTGSMADSINTFIDMYTEEHPNIKIEQVSATPSDYKTQKLPVAMSAGEQGDIFFTYGAGYSKPFVDAGSVMALDEYMEKYGAYDRLLGGVTENAIYDGTLYGLPLKKWSVVLYCNKELFEDNNIPYPETFEDLLSAVDQFKELGITPISLGAKEPIAIELIQNALAVKCAGAEAVTAAQNGTGSFDTAEIAQSAQLLLDLMDRGAFADGVLGLSAEEASMEFHTGYAAMFVTGSWEALKCESESSDLNGKVKAMPFPVVEGGKGATHASGGSIDYFMISENCKYKEEAFDFAIKLAEYLSEEAYKMGDSLPAWKVDIDSSEVNPVLAQIKDFTDGYEQYALAWDTALIGEAIEKHLTLLQEVLGRVVTPEEFAKQMQEVNQKVLAAQ